MSPTLLHLHADELMGSEEIRSNNPVLTEICIQSLKVMSTMV